MNQPIKWIHKQQQLTKKKENFSNAFSIDSPWCGRVVCVSETHHTIKNRKDPDWNVAYSQNSLGQLVVVNTSNKK